MAPSVRTVVDIGGQDCKVISIDKEGRVLEFAMNDRCAAGTGRFFEGMARALCCGLEGISALENQGESPATISHQCSVASRLASMTRRVGLVPEVALTGGCSKNLGLALALEGKLNITVLTLPNDPQIAGALGAALFAVEKARAQVA
jgi:activator of 2-hydroxyglutaryl-CoA dehydratase